MDTKHKQVEERKDEKETAGMNHQDFLKAIGTGFGAVGLLSLL